MPKATRAKGSSSRKDPISKPSKQEGSASKSKAEPQPSEETSDNDNAKPAAKRATRKDTGKDSHLYTDDNPATTLHGTGFKDAETANNTLQLISKRSLTYQFQTINTLFNRARNHPSVKKAETPDEAPAGIKEALEIFKTWLDETYPASKASLRAGGFKPLLSKTFVEGQLGNITTAKDTGEVDAEAADFASLYVSLPKNRRLGNVLLDDDKPGEADWEVTRYEALNRLVPEGDEDGKGWAEDRLWNKSGGPSAEHYNLIAWGWSPVGERALKNKGF